MSSQLAFTPVEEIPQIREHLRGSFRAGKARSIAFRKEQLLQLAYLFQDNVERFQDSLRKDLGRSTFESNMFDISTIISEALFTYKHIDSWVKPDKASFDINIFALSPKIHKEPRGTVLIICPFNYPLWSLGPITGAIAAGCAVAVKPSEMTPATSQLLTELFPKYLNQDLYRIVNGAIDETTKLLSLQWDHILYTGSGRVGRIVAIAAAKHLTPVTLELGGKSPVIVDTDADFELAARRILWGKSINSGQTCTAPDFVVIPYEVQDKLVDALRVEWTKFFGSDARASGSFSRLCAPSHWERVAGLLRDTRGEVVLGGQTDRSDKFIAPTVVKNVTFDDSLMKEELFGPILPIIPVPDVKASLDYINGHDHPLALYVFSKDSKFCTYVRENTLSGTFLANDVIVHGGSSVTPFGGVGASGYGAHRGKYSFDTFSHYRPAFKSPKWIDLLMHIRYPPYTEKNLKKMNASMMPPIPYARPGEKQPFNWKRWLVVTVVFGLIAANKQRVIDLVKA